MVRSPVLEHEHCLPQVVWQTVHSRTRGPEPNSTDMAASQHKEANIEIGRECLCPLVVSGWPEPEDFLPYLAQDAVLL